VIFISNKHISQFPQAIVSRSQKVDVTLTTDEIVEIIEHVFEKRDDISTEVKSDVLEFVKENASEATDLNIRSATALITLRNKFGANKWKRIAKYSFCGCK
jgi:transcriptional regulator